MSDSESPLRDDAQNWRRQLVDFLDDVRTPLPDRNQLSPLQHEHRKVTGGLLLQFMEFLETTVDDNRYPQLDDHPLPERLFVVVSDEAGLHAADELMDTDTDQVCALRKEEWRAFLENPETDDDEAFVHHYQFWSVWHQNIPDDWESPDLESGYDYWVHEEGFALADRIGRGAQHLWRYDGDELDLIDEELNSWSSNPTPVDTDDSEDD